MPDPLRIGFVTIHAAADRLAYSGTAFAMRESLRRHPDVALTDIDGLSTLLYPLWRAKQAGYWFGLKKRYWMNRQPAVVAGYGRQVSARLASVGPIDVLFSPGSIPLAKYTGPISTVFWADATFDRLADFYPEASNFARETVLAGHRLEREALNNCRLAIYTSTWAAESAATTYQTPQAKLETVSYGANIDPPTGPPNVDDMMAHRLHLPTRLLFIGSHWQRKGGDIAVATTCELVRRGQAVTLDLVGCTPPTAVPNFVNVHGFLDKRSPDSRERLAGLFRDAHVLLLPTRADCVPMGIAEAYAHGLPVAATDVGGVASVVEDHVTGRLLPLSATASEWATAVAEMVRSPDRYRSVARSGLETFRRSLNWPAAVARVVDLLRDRVTRSHAA